MPATSLHTNHPGMFSTSKTLFKVRVSRQDKQGKVTIFSQFDLTLQNSVVYHTFTIYDRTVHAFLVLYKDFRILNFRKRVDLPVHIHNRLPKLALNTKNADFILV